VTPSSTVHRVMSPSSCQTTTARTRSTVPAEMRH
jgi:hypothetical protein